MIRPRKLACLGVRTASARQLFTQYAPHSLDIDFDDPDSDESAIAVLAEADYAILWSRPMPARLMKAAPRLRFIQRIGSGTDLIDLRVASELGIPVANMTGVNAESSSELAVLLMLAVLRRLPEAHLSIVSGRWLRYEMRGGTYELRGKQVGIIGLGQIGRVVAGHVRGFGARPVYYNSRRLDPAEETGLGVPYLPLDELLRSSDIVTLHMPLTAETKRMIGRRELSLMKPTAVVVNTARGGVVDERALVEALRDRRIMGAGLDCLEMEPPSPDNPLFQLSNVVLTPHVAGVTEDSQVALIQRALGNVARVDAGEALAPRDMVVPASHSRAADRAD
jgi:phosphoglycerate dehydrogenase-like enzyme